MKSVKSTLMDRGTLFLLLIVFQWFCTPKLAEILEEHPVTIEPYEPEEELRFHNRLRINAVCSGYEGYVPDTSHLDHFIEREVKVCFHFMNSTDSTNNFREDEASSFAWHLLESVNRSMRNNRKLELPENNDIPVLPTLIQYKWTSDPNSEDRSAVKHHYDDELFYIVTRGKNRNNADRRAIDKYARTDNVINIFVMPHHPDSIASSSYSGHRSGIALGNSIKICGFYETGNKSYWTGTGLLAHELGHVLGLSHAWTGYDGCDDTAPHRNVCYSHTGVPPCDGPVSNNMMDYNNRQNALSPCQIGKMHANLSRHRSAQRDLLVKNWCDLDSSKTVIITDTIVWNGSKDLQGHLVIADGGHLTINCRVSFPTGAELIVEPGGQLFLDSAHLHSDCGQYWNGIRILGRGARVGRVFGHGDYRIEDLKNYDNPGT